MEVTRVVVSRLRAAVSSLSLRSWVSLDSKSVVSSSKR